MSRWKRNLEKFKNVALPVAGFALGGPGGAALGGALAGATGKGRPTLGNVAKGAGTAYLGGQLAGGLGIQGGEGFGALASTGKSAFMNPKASVSNLFTGGEGGSGITGTVRGAGRFATENPELSAGIARGAGTAFAGAQQADVARGQLELATRQQEEREREAQEERERRQRVAQLLAPLFQQMAQRQGLNYG